MDYINYVMHVALALLFGVVQGITEFLPVSSSGHLILMQSIFNMGDDLMLFNILLHVATLLAVCIMFRKRLWQLVKKPLQPMNYYLVLATVITVIFVLLFKDVIDRTLNASVLPITFMLTAVVLFSTVFLRPNRDMTYRSAAFTGLIQGIAVVPGFSRSGFTISAAMFAGTKREQAAEFSFLMSIPIIIAALVYEVASNPSPSVGGGWPALVVAFLAALISGMLAIKFMLHIIRRIGLHWFAVYLVPLAIATIFLV